MNRPLIDYRVLETEDQVRFLPDADLETIVRAQDTSMVRCIDSVKSYAENIRFR